MATNELAREYNINPATAAKESNCRVTEGDNLQRKRGKQPKNLRYLKISPLLAGIVTGPVTVQR